MPRDISRRTLVKSAIAVGTTAAAVRLGRSQTGTKAIRVAAVQMHATLGEVDGNLESAERWARRALR
jgi:hypothetical protein